MLTSLILPLTLLLILLLDITICRTTIRWYGRWWKWLYIVLSVAVVLALGVAGWCFSTYPTATAMATMTWCVWLFTLNFGTKLLFVAPVLLGRIVSRCTGRKYRTPAVIGLVGACLCGVVMIYGATVGRNSVRVEHIEIESSEIPQAFDGYKIVQFSDLHIGNLSLTNLLENAVDTINAQHPDLIVQSGDLVNIHVNELTDENLALLKRLHATDGVVAVLGNHDLGFYLPDSSYISPRETFDRLKIVQRQTLGWILLDNEHIKVRRGSDSIVVAGVTYPKNMNHNNFNSTYGGSNLGRAMAGVNDSSFSLLVSHSPKLFDSIPSVAKVDLTVSGHVHSMQTKVTVGHWQWSPAKWLYNLYSGYYENQNYKLYVNDGLGYVLFPMRLGTRPEITVFTLKHQ